MCGLIDDSKGGNDYMDPATFVKHMVSEDPDYPGPNYYRDDQDGN